MADDKKADGTESVKKGRVIGQCDAGARGGIAPLPEGRCMCGVNAQSATLHV